MFVWGIGFDMDSLVTHTDVEKEETSDIDYCTTQLSKTADPKT